MYETETPLKYVGKSFRNECDRSIDPPDDRLEGVKRKLGVRSERWNFKR